MKKFFIVLSLMLILPLAARADFSQPLRYGMRNSEVNQLQQFLTDQGLYFGPVSGNFYGLTQNAVKKFQKQHALKVTGIWDSKTLSAANGLLGSAVQPTSPAAINSGSYSLGFSDGSTFNSSGQQTSLPNNSGTLTPPKISTPVILSQPTTAVPATTPTPSPSPAPVVSRLLPKVLQYGRMVSWPNGNGWGNVNDNCNNCVVLITDMPTTATIHIMPNPTLRGGPALDGYAINNQQTISVYADNTLTTTHVFLFSHMNMDKAKTYLFIVDAVDSSGGKYAQIFSGVDSINTSIPGPFNWGENQTISWNSDYPSQYEKSSLPADVPLTTVQAATNP